MMVLLQDIHLPPSPSLTQIPCPNRSLPQIRRLQSLHLLLSLFLHRRSCLSLVVVILTCRTFVPGQLFFFRVNGQGSTRIWQDNHAAFLCSLFLCLQAEVNKTTVTMNLNLHCHQRLPFPGRKFQAIEFVLIWCGSVDIFLPGTHGRFDSSKFFSNCEG